MPPERKKVLVLDDDVQSALYMCVLLSRMGLDVVPADNGLTALNILKASTSDLIMVDMDAHAKENITTLKHIKNDKRLSFIPVVAMSYGPAEETRKRSLELGCSTYLTKPAKMKDLHRILEDFIFSPMGWRRRYIRANFNVKARIEHDGALYEVYTQTISEGGMYVRKGIPFPLGSEVRVSLPTGEGGSLDLKGTVIYTKGLYGDTFKLPPGMAIEFKGLTEGDTLAIMDYISRLIADDISKYQEAVIDR